MHPIERLRYVARTAGGAGLLLGEAAGALASFTGDPAALVTACRRLVDRHPGSGPMWSLSATVLCAGDPEEAAWAEARAFERDPTPSYLAEELPAAATVTVIGWPEQAAVALRRRGDLTVLVVGADPRRATRVFESYDVAGEVVDPASIGGAVAASDAVVLEAEAAGPHAALCAAGSLPAALVAAHAQVPVWLVAGRGRVLPGPLWDALLARRDRDRPWDEPDEVVPVSLANVTVTPDGRRDMPGPLRPGCPVAPELLREVG